MSEFYFDLRDVRFNLYDFLDVETLTNTPRFQDFDVDMFDGLIAAAYEQAQEVLFPLNQVGDTKGVRFVDGRVLTPRGWTEGYRLFSDMGWGALPISQEHGGQGVPLVIHAATQEMFIAANASFVFTPALTTGVVGLIAEFGTEEQRAMYVGRLLSGQWTGTMCLTESTAGTAVPDLKTVAKPIEGRESMFHIQGQKIFISSGDHDYAENIVHMVLARVGDDPNVSLFVVPRLRITSDGSLEGNDVATLGIEEKLGVHGSSTCSLGFGEEHDCEGWLLGERGGGLHCMFKMMNEARIGVGLQGVGLANLAYQRSVVYAKQRIQGTHIKNMRKKDAPRVAIIEHPDVRRMLMYMKAVSEGGRALALYAAFCVDSELAAQDEATQQRWGHQLEIITPILKAWASDEGFRAAEMGVQVHGGNGYIREYGMEQLLRDVKIASIYEGTNGIQALDLLGRKVARGGGIMMMTMLNEVNRFLTGPPREGAFAAEVAALAEARDAVASTAMFFAQRSMGGDIEYSALHACAFLQMFGDLLVGWLLLRQASTAKRLYDARLVEIDTDPMEEEPGMIHEDDNEARFLHGKMATARFFAHQILPRVHARVRSIKSEDRSALTVVL